MAEVKINITAQDRATDTLSAVEKSLQALPMNKKVTQVSYFFLAQIRRHIRTITKYRQSLAIVLKSIGGNIISSAKTINVPIILIISHENSLMNALKRALKNFSSYSIGGL